MAWTTPEYTRSRVDRAAKILVDTHTVPPEIFHDMSSYDEALGIVNNWRSSHALPLQIMKMTLRSRAQSIFPDALVAQRIKRIPAIVFKLKQNPKMKFSQMQDVGGCRAVVKSVSNVERLVDLYLKATSKNARRAGEFVERYDYLSNPKSTGYRGVHLVYKYRTDSDRLGLYNGLRIEIQIRSDIQHAWATAVETVDAFTEQALKSNVGKETWKRFFALVSSGLAMLEKKPNVPGTPENITDLRDELRVFRQEITLLEGFHKATETIQNRAGEAFLLQLNTEDRKLRTKGFPRELLPLAQQEYLAIEKANKDNPHIQSVLVSVESFKALRRAYPNYFLDITVFVKLVKQLLDL